MKMFSKRRGKGLSTIVALVLCFVMCFALAACGTESVVGPQGPQGPAGVQGDKGDKGETGLVPDTTTPSADITEKDIAANGTMTMDMKAKGKFYSDFTTLEEEQEYAADFNIQLVAEGSVLLKNEKATLPLRSGEKRISVFGSRSDNIIYGGGGSGSGDASKAQTVKNSLTAAGFKMNPSLVNIYDVNDQVEELPVSALASAVSSYNMYSDAAVIIITRGGSEFSDNKAYNVPGHSNKDDHYLMLQDNEKALINHVKTRFNKVVIVINSASPLEIANLEDDDKIGSILWVGMPGTTGIMALGQILNGEVNPSGQSADIWTVDFKQDPVWFNYGDMTHLKDANGIAMNNHVYENKAGTAESSKYRTIEYREDIYMGYKWYETADEEGFYKSEKDGYYNRKNGVVYPFGHGLSYTNFEWTLDNVKDNATISKANSTVTMRVRVKNTGTTEGKEVVQVYYSAPYTKGGIEKASVNLVEFGKTKLLKPGESEILTITFPAQEMASFDYNDANKNGFKGYELEKGDYKISLRTNSHDEVLKVTRTVADTIKITKDLVSGADVEAMFSREDAYKSTNAALDTNKISRANLKLPASPTIADRTVSSAKVKEYDDRITYYSFQDKTTDPWYVKSVPTGWTQSDAENNVVLNNAIARKDGSKVATLLSEMSGVTYKEATKSADGTLTAATDEESKKWDAFMNQLTWAELQAIVNLGSFATTGVDAIGKAVAKDQDGPAMLKPGGTFWACEVIIASTFNKDLAYEQGLLVGSESLLMNVNGWYGPAMNTHRHPLAGRNFEYYSQDGIHAGIISAYVIKGATEKGVNVYMKHVFLNDQEADRGTAGGLFTWASEQAIRETYAKPFEYAIKYGNCSGIMTAFNRIGDYEATSNFAFLEELVRQEWGFKGAVLTDMYSKNYRDINIMVRTGNELPLGKTAVEGTWDKTAKKVMVLNEAGDNTMASPTHHYAVRKSAQRVLYVAANTNVNKNGLSQEKFKNVTAKMTLATKNSASIAQDLTKTGAAIIVYTTETELPKGITLSKAGILTGTPDKAQGTLTVRVKAQADGLYTFEYDAVVSFVGAIAYSGNLTTMKGAINGTFSSEMFKVGGTFISSNWMGDTVNVISKVEYSVLTDKDNLGTLPAGLTLGLDGKLTGTITAAAGDYTITLRCKYTYGSRNSTANYDQVVKLTVVA